MALIKSDVTGQYFIVGMDVAKDQRLGLTERGMMLTLLSLPPDWDFTIEGMTRILPDGRGRIRSSIKKLEDMGYLKRNQSRKEDGVFGKCHIEVYQKAILTSTGDDNPMSDTPPSHNPTTDNLPQVNNHISNNKKYISNKGVGTLVQNDYERLISLHDKAVVDYQIGRIKANHYVGYMNFDMIDLMCREYEARRQVGPPVEKSTFLDFEQMDYPPGYFEELERKLVQN